MKQMTPQPSDAYVLTKRQRRYLLFKRAFDTVAALLALIVLAVPMALIALTQKVLSPHETILFCHQRVGKDGKLFKLIKFRSMRSTAPEYKAAASFTDKEAYITRFGRFLRRTSMDELPQLFLVLTGKMSLIGPRPLIPQEEWIHRKRQSTGVYQLRPGMTGWAQVNGRDCITDEEKAKLDQEYLENVSFAWDWKIFWATLGKVIMRTDVNEHMYVF